MAPSSASALSAPSRRSLVRNALSSVLTYDNARTLVFWWILYTYAIRALRHLKIYGITTTALQVYQWLSRNVLLLALRMPQAKRKVEAELGQALADLENKMVVRDPKLPRLLQLPQKGASREEVDAQLELLGGLSHPAWEEGKVSGAVYHGGAEINEVILNAFKRFTVSNPLHPDVFPGVRAMEAQVVKMVLSMYNAPEEGAGATTSGGTESILLACLAYRNWAREVKGIKEPEMVVPVSAHAAFHKASHYFGIKIRQVPVDSHTRKASVKHVARAINRNTCMIVGSAPNFPDGIIDDIPAMAILAKKHGIGMHVDCCLGSFIVPFLDKAGFPTEPFDFRVEGVTSISCDNHKYAFAAKGTSVVMYANKDWRSYQYYSQPDWAGGVYASPTLAGSRPGALIAAAWAVMSHIGEDGYIASCREIVGAARTLETRIREEIPELYILGKPLASVVAFGSEKLNIYEVGDLLSKRGFHLAAIANPPALHIAVTRLTVPAVPQLIDDLKWAVKEAKSKPSAKGSLVSLYGLGTSSAVGPTMVSRLAKGFLDVLYVA